MPVTAAPTATATSLRRAVTRLNRRLRSERPPGALPVMQLTVLGHLLREGPSMPSEIASAEHHHPQSLTRVLAALEDDGLISRSPSPDDGRASVLTLTPAGQLALGEDMAVRDDWLDAALTELTETEVQVLELAAALMQRLAGGY